MTMVVEVRTATPDGPIVDKVTVCAGDDGHARCGVSFNPDQNADVRKIKGLAAGLMQAIAQYRDNRGSDDHDGRRCMATAMTQLESAQMFAVKGLFTERKPLRLTA